MRQEGERKKEAGSAERKREGLVRDSKTLP